MQILRWADLDCDLGGAISAIDKVLSRLGPTWQLRLRDPPPPDEPPPPPEPPPPFSWKTLTPKFGHLKLTCPVSRLNLQDLSLKVWLHLH